MSSVVKPKQASKPTGKIKLTASYESADLGFLTDRSKLIILKRFESNELVSEGGASQYDTYIILNIVGSTNKTFIRFYRAVFTDSLLHCSIWQHSKERDVYIKTSRLFLLVELVIFKKIFCLCFHRLYSK